MQYCLRISLLISSSHSLTSAVLGEDGVTKESVSAEVARGTSRVVDAFEAVTTDAVA
jgi:hypothetical protein